MSNVFKRLWSSDKSNIVKSKDIIVEEIQEYQPFNPFTQLLFLEQHTDIVRLLLKVDLKRCVSAADDNLAVVWDIQFGYKLVTLSGHTRPITCMIKLDVRGDNSVCLVTGSSDKQIRIWNLDTGDCLYVLTQHQSSVKCLLMLDNAKWFCSGGETICLWNNKGQLLTSYREESSESAVNSLISIRNGRLVAATDRHLDVFSLSKSENTITLSLIKRLPPHREPIKCLLSITDDQFASASLDGTIKLWRTDTLLSNRYFNSITEEYQGADRTFPFSVEKMICFQQKYLVAAIGSGFSIYNCQSGQTILKKEHAHHSKINDLCFTCDGLYLATTSVDGSIRLWSCIDAIKHCIDGAINPRNSKLVKESLSSDDSNTISLYKIWFSSETAISLVGECLAHSGSVQVLLDCDNESIISCDVDGLVIVWKNESIQMMKRSHVLQATSFCDGIV
ncbi:regulation of autophagy [Mactra antiquata]